MGKIFKLTDESIFISKADFDAKQAACAIREQIRQLEEFSAKAKRHADLLTDALQDLACRPSRERRANVADLADAQTVRLAPVCGLTATIEEAAHELTTTLRELRETNG